MRYKIKVDNSEIQRYLFSKVIEDFQRWFVLRSNLERPRLNDGQLGWYIEDVEQYWEEKQEK